MKLITRDTDYAIRALVCIAASGERIVTVEELASKLSMPRPFLRKVLQVLNKSGILKSYKGKGGGFALGKPAEKVRIVDIMKIFQGPFSLNDHLLKKRKCPYMDVCRLKRKLDAIEEKLYAGLARISIDQLIMGQDDN